MRSYWLLLFSPLSTYAISSQQSTEPHFPLLFVQLFFHFLPDSSGLFFSNFSPSSCKYFIMSLIIVSPAEGSPIDYQLLSFRNPKPTFSRTLARKKVPDTFFPKRGSRMKTTIKCPGSVTEWLRHPKICGILTSRSEV